MQEALGGSKQSGRSSKRFSCGLINFYLWIDNDMFICSVN